MNSFAGYKDILERPKYYGGRFFFGLTGGILGMTEYIIDITHRENIKKVTIERPVLHGQRAGVPISLEPTRSRAPKKISCAFNVSGDELHITVPNQPFSSSDKVYINGIPLNSQGERVPVHTAIYYV
jgi:hypothetical protein